MLAILKASFFCPKNVGFLKPKLGLVADLNPQLIHCSLTKTSVAKSYLGMRF